MGLDINLDHTGFVGTSFDSDRQHGKLGSAWALGPNKLKFKVKSFTEDKEGNCMNGRKLLPKRAFNFGESNNGKSQWKK